jgi:hypothetical protein
LKRGVHAGDHSVIWTEQPIMFPGEREKGLTKSPIRMIPGNSRIKLDNASRLNYAKLYTVEYNIKVWFIGKIDSGSEHKLLADYNNVHPPLTNPGYQSMNSTTPAAYAVTPYSMTTPAFSDATATYQTPSAYSTSSQNIAGVQGYDQNLEPATSYPNTQTNAYPTMPQDPGGQVGQPDYDRQDDLYDDDNAGNEPMRRPQEGDNNRRKRRESAGSRSGGSRSGHKK